MIRRQIASALCIAVLTATAVVPVANAQERYPILAPCTRDDVRYSSLFFNQWEFDRWPEEYHNTTSEVIEEYLEPIEDIECTSDNLLPVTATSSLGQLADKLVPWQDPNDRTKLERNDISLVLQEHLRMYECALVEHYYYLPIDIIEQEFASFVTTVSPLPQFIPGFNFAALLKEMARRRGIIKNEIALSRPTLERALLLVNSINRLAPFDAELMCVQRSSLDLRNGFALTAEASQCLPRAWDAKDALRDI